MKARPRRVGRRRDRREPAVRWTRVSDRRLAVRLTVIGIGALLATACNLTQPSPSLAPGESVQGQASECSSVDIRGPSGATVALTGAWRSNDLGLYDIYQRGSCLYWLGMSQYPGEEPGTTWTNVFVGTVQGDFTIVGRWGDVPFNPDSRRTSWATAE